MSTLSLILALLYISALFLFSALPLLRNTEQLASTDQDLANSNLIDNREQLLQMLRDLKLDFQLNKISDTEFEVQNNSLRSELALILEKTGQTQT